MFTKQSTSMTFTAALLSAALGFSSAASANHHDHIDRVALRVQKRAQQLLEETRHYRRAPGYHQLVRQTRLVRDTAIHIHDVTHFEGNVPHLRHDVALIDRSFHQLEGLFCHIEEEIECGRCHVDVNTNRFRRRMKQLEREIHHLADGLAKICAAPHAAYRPVNRYSISSATHVPPFVNNFSAYQNGFYNEFNRSPRVDYHRSRSSGFHGINQPDFYRSASARNARGFSIGGGSTRIWIGY